MSPTAAAVVRAIATIANTVALVLVVPAAASCGIEARLNGDSESVFAFWTHVFALLPGLPGLYLRRAFYCLTLQRCSLHSAIGFGAIVFHRQTQIEDEVYVGPYAVIGRASLRRGCLIGTRANLLSGSAQHQMREDGSWAPSDHTRFIQIEIGEHAWIGEAAIVMADVGASAMVAAGAVVSAPVRSGVVVVGNPARFARELRPDRVRIAEPPPAASAIEASYRPFIDWLKCLGMLVIVYGHVAAWAPLASLPPINAKQLGVACFLFITGYTLSRETRVPWVVAFNRLFEVYLFGLMLALMLSVVSLTTTGRLLTSNYAPFAGGVNVLFNFFPANPTTWYLGTYLHVIVLWALLIRRIPLAGWMLAVSFAIEVVVRAILMQTAGRFVAYMALPNWATVFLLGYWYGYRTDPSARASEARALLAAAAFVLSVAGWTIAAARMPFAPDFPFMQLKTGNPLVAALVVSGLVSIIYVGLTWLLFFAVEPFAAPRPVRFVARNTLVIFLAHMPVVYALTPVLSHLTMSRGLRSAVLGIVCVAGLGVVSEALHAAIQPRALRARLYARFRRRAAEPALSAN